ncbi:MAG: hypothetical protein LKJ76_00680 [Lachnospiraceae bacterium]|nr:hypothetical protein [Lachnospiraceae bacterium]
MEIGAGSPDNSDFKYEMNDLTVLYYGARFTYGEILEDKATNFKLKHILSDYVLKEVTPDTTLESHFYYMQKGSASFQLYEQLKTKVRISEPCERKKLFGGTEQVFRERICTLEELTSVPPEEKERRGILVREIQISKLALMAFTL